MTVARIVAAWNRFWFAPGRAEDLAISRILFATGLLIFSLTRPLHEWGDVPAAWLRPASYFRLLGIPIAASGTLHAFEIVWHAAMATLAVGLFTRTSAAIVCAGSLYLFGLDAPEFLGRSYTPAVFVPAILAVSRCGDVLSIDAWRRRRRGAAPVELPDEYGWPARLVCAFLAYTFFAAGVAKIRDTGFPGWMLSDMTSRSLLAGNYWYLSRDRAWLPIGPALLRVDERLGIALGILTQFAELLYPLALFFRAARLVVVPLMVAILAGIAVLMGPFFAPTILAHVFWVSWTKAWRRRPRA